MLFIIILQHLHWMGFLYFLKPSSLKSRSKCQTTQSLDLWYCNKWESWSKVWRDKFCHNLFQSHLLTLVDSDSPCQGQEYCRIQIDTSPWLWHTWQNFVFVTLFWKLWHGQDFVSCGCWTIHFDGDWPQMHSSVPLLKRKFTIYWQKAEFWARIAIFGYCHSSDLSSVPLCDVTATIFRHIRYPPWHVTDKLIWILQ